MEHRSTGLTVAIRAGLLPGFGDAMVRMIRFIRKADYSITRSRFKIFLMIESFSTEAPARCIFSRVIVNFVEPNTHEKRITRTP
ncbi:hypothetical protein WT33_31430 [Burkholderia stagnalis]|nr:hypothetical protein WT33_31430 [Burkholderia stagnalis]